MAQRDPNLMDSIGRNCVSNASPLPIAIPERIARPAPGWPAHHSFVTGCRDQNSLRRSSLRAARRVATCARNLARHGRSGDARRPVRCSARRTRNSRALLRRVGAIWHASGRSERSFWPSVLRQLVEWLGRDNHRAALRFIDLAPGGTAWFRRWFGCRCAVDVDVLMGLIERDALIAVNAWCRQQPAALAERLRLKLKPCPDVDDKPPASHRDRGVLIVDRVVMTLASDVHGGTSHVHDRTNAHD